MELNISSIKDLTSIPKEYTSNSRAIEYLYQNNPNIFENVADNLNLSFEFIEKITELINNGTLRLTENNIKLLDSLYSENIIDILKNHFDYLYLINENNFNQTGLATDPVFLELLEEHKIEITGNSPYLITLCSDYIIKQYIEDKVNIETVLPYIMNWHNNKQKDLIQEYFKKGNYDLSIFYCKNIDNDSITPFFENISMERNNDSVEIKANNIESILSLLSFELPFSISDIYLSDSRDIDTNILSLLKKINEQNINLYVNNGLSINSTLERDSEFLELCGNVGNIELAHFDLEEFKQLLEKSKEHPGVVINVKLDDFMRCENYFLNLNTEVPINIVSEKNVSILSLNEMKKINSKSDSIIAGIKNSSLSPYEKYIAAYNIVKTFKKYRYYLDNEDADQLVPDQSRNPYLVLINQYAVCAGYASLLHLFLKKLDIPSHYWILDSSDKSEAGGKYPHARLYVNIVDDKYGINGYYMCDPTWDIVDKESKDLYGYKYLNMSVGESHDYGKDSPSYYYFSDDYDVFNDQMFINTDDYLSKVYSLDELFTIIEDLDPDFYSQLSNLKNEEEQKETIKKHFREKTYRAISLEKKYTAIISVLEFQSEKEFSDMEKQTIRENLYNIDHEMDAPKITSIPDDEEIDDWIDFESEETISPSKGNNGMDTPKIVSIPNTEKIDDWIDFKSEETIGSSKKNNGMNTQKITSISSVEKIDGWVDFAPKGIINTGKQK